MTPKTFETELESIMAEGMINDEKSTDEWVLDSINDYYMRMDG